MRIAAVFLTSEQVYSLDAVNFPTYRPFHMKKGTERSMPFVCFAGSLKAMVQYHSFSE